MQEAAKYQLMFSLLQSSLFGTPAVSELPIPADVDWDAVLQEMQAQTVHGLVEPLLDALPIRDPAVKERWRMRCIQQQSRWYQVASAQQELIALLDSAGIPSVILKGTAAGLSYPHPECRCSGDVDILVKRADYQKAAALMEADGYVFDHGDNDGSRHHTAFTKNGVSFELHYRLGIVSSDDEARLQFFEAQIEAGETVQIDGFSFHVFPRLCNGLTLLFHIDQHLRSGLGLRQIVDWAMFVHQNLTDAVWETEFQPYLQACGMETFAITVTDMAHRYLGLPVGVDAETGRSLTWCQTADSTLSEQLMNYILEKGNMGKKSGEAGHIAFFYLITKTPARLFKRLQAGGMCNWSAAREHKLLRPFAWIYQVGHILRQLRTSKQSLHSMKELRQEGLTQRELITKLGLNLDRTIE